MDSVCPSRNEMDGGRRLREALTKRLSLRGGARVSVAVPIVEGRGERLLEVPSRRTHPAQEGAKVSERASWICTRRGPRLVGGLLDNAGRGKGRGRIRREHSAFDARDDGRGHALGQDLKRIAKIGEGPAEQVFERRAAGQCSLEGGDTVADVALFAGLVAESRRKVAEPTDQGGHVVHDPASRSAVVRRAPPERGAYLRLRFRSASDSHAEILSRRFWAARAEARGRVASVATIER
jgi:hypothetical protein